MKIDLTCPVELWQCSKPTREDPECSFVLNNLSEKTVTSVQVTLACFDEEQELLFRQIERLQGLRAGAGERFSAVILPTTQEAASSLELVVEKVWFDDATIWRKKGDSLTEYHPNALPMGRKLDQLRFVAGKDAVGYPSLQEHVWVCVCGRANGKTAERCCRCGRGMEAVFASYRKDNVDRLIAVHEQKLVDIAKKAREEAGKLEEQRQKQRQQKKNHLHKTMKLTALTACLAIAVVALVLWGIPAFRYTQAESLLNAGKFEEARAAFAGMADYREAKEQIILADYLEAKAWLEEDSPESLPKALKGFEALSDYEDSAALAWAATYRMGIQALEAKSYDIALGHFETVKGYQDSSQKIAEIHYLQADALLDAKNYDEAKKAFIALGAYQDAAEKALQCDYEAGLAYETGAAYPEAIERFIAVGEYEDAPLRLNSSRYLLAEQKLAEEDFETAGDLYLQVGDYLDAKIKANNSLYQLGQERFQAGDYEKAESLFSRIIPYLDSESRSWESIYQRGMAAQTASDYETAASLFASIPKHKDAADKLQQNQYLLANVSIAAGKLEEAEALLLALSGYQDSDKLLRQTRYQLGEKAASEGNYEKALSFFSALGNYADSSARLKDCRYQLARNSLFDLKYEVAIEGFTALGNYEDSAALLAQATYEYALERKNAGDADTALSLLAALPENEEARKELVSLTLTEAQRKREAGDLDGADRMLLALGNEAEAVKLMNTWKYAQALEKKNDGLYKEAGILFAALEDYEDAAAQAAQCDLLYYGVVADPAREAFGKKDYPTVIETLRDFSLIDLPKAYQDLSEIYEQSCYAYAEELYADGKPYEALPYYQLIPQYRDVAQKLERRTYLLLGHWRSSDGQEAQFREDGTCTLLGEELFFSVDGYAVYTGTSKDDLTLTHRLTNATQSGLTLRDTRQGQNVVYKFERVKDETDSQAALSQEAETLSVLPAPEDFLVQEENDDPT